MDQSHGRQQSGDSGPEPDKGRLASAGLEFEGTWEEISKHYSALSGRKVRVTLLDDEGRTDEASQCDSNVAMIEIMKKIDEIQQGMEPKKGKSGLDYLREGRSGDMYGYGKYE